MSPTPYNHGGRHRHAAADAIETLNGPLVTRFEELRKQAQVYDPHNPGQANRLADYARDLEAVAHNLVHFLEHAGAASD